jgi:hypothetical protein
LKAGAERLNIPAEARVYSEKALMLGRRAFLMDG